MYSHSLKTRLHYQFFSNRFIELIEKLIKRKIVKKKFHILIIIINKIKNLIDGFELLLN